MNNLAALEDAPLFQPIRTNIDGRRETRKITAQRTRKSNCYKRALTYKQALSYRNRVMKERGVEKLYVYKCRCDFWHLTKQPPRV